MLEKASDELTAEIVQFAAENEALRHRVQELEALLMGSLFAKQRAGGSEAETRRLDDVEDAGAVKEAATSSSTDMVALLKTP